MPKYTFVQLQGFHQTFEAAMSKSNDSLLAVQAVAEEIAQQFETKMTDKVAESTRLSSALELLISRLLSLPRLFQRIFGFWAIMHLTPKETWAIRLARNPEMLFFMDTRDKTAAGLIVNGTCVEHKFLPFGFSGDRCIKERCAICADFRDVNS